MRSTETQHQVAPELAAQICTLLARIFREDISGQGSENADVKSTRELAEKGYAGAQTHLAHMYYFGHGAPQDYAEARKWLLEAAAFDVAEAQSKLGMIYANGYGVRRNFSKAGAWFRK